ncbi:MAG: cation diffusion facilitator family transporter [Thermoplasmatales archaeon]|jgi:cation diffusion facilitator family transporter|nr:cation diffusion facilitator family transporter [Candidatus Thermoplasmatota archaeon]MCL6002879.1 cation diffusion facilitator family transporter [Candidatus Thermoplasmatota archaeon]MDA8056281.1 cation diffusion facilitator family transporter [Thermoplasmatales archaeon]
MVLVKTTTRNVVVRAFLGDLLIAITKYIAAIFSGSAAMLAEAIHSSSDTVNQFLLLLGYNLSTKKDASKFPFGRGREQFFWSFVVAILVFGISGVLTFFEGVLKLTTPYKIRDPISAYLVLAFSFAVDGYVLFISSRFFLSKYRKQGYADPVSFMKDFKDPVLLTALVEDTAALAGVGTAFVGITLSLITKNNVFDAASSIVIGIIMMVSGLYLSKKSKDLLIGEGISARDQKKIEEILKSNSSVNKILDIKAIYQGPEKILLAMDLNFKDGLSTGEIERAIDEIELSIKSSIPFVDRIYVEAEEKIPDLKPQERLYP